MPCLVHFLELLVEGLEDEDAVDEGALGSLCSDLEEEDIALGTPPFTLDLDLELFLELAFRPGFCPSM